MFERFTERARQVVVLAHAEARALRHGYIGTEHILLGLIREEEGVAARVLESLAITLERVRPQVVGIGGRGEKAASGMIPFTPRAKKALELALREALSLGCNDIGTEHILLGLLREDEGVAARILLDFDTDADKIRNEVIRVTSGPGGRPRPSTAPGSPPIPPEFLLERELTTGGARWLWTRLAPEIQNRLGREPDAGDLLLVLASVRDSLIARTLGELGVDDRAIADALERARVSGPSPLDEKIDQTRRAKEEAIENRQFEQAASLRDDERRLVKLRSERDEHLLARLRARLGLSEESGERPPPDSPA